MILAFTAILSAFSLNAQSDDELFRPASDSVKSYMRARTTIAASPRINEVSVSKKGILTLNFSDSFTDFPYTDEDVTTIYSILNDMLPQEYSSYRGKIAVTANGQTLESLVSNIASSRRSTVQVKEHLKYAEKYHKKLKAPLVKNVSKSLTITNGLQNRHIAMWQSHGFYYEPSLKRWEWQRARIFETVEDLYTQSYVLPFLVPMLENAGAVVMLPRERDWQKNEVIVDNDGLCGYSETGSWGDAPDKGFANPKETYIFKENPFEMGTARMAAAASKKNPEGKASWTPDIPEDGTYGVYVSYKTLKNSATDAQYTVHHKGGETTFSVNQQMGGGTWIFLGYFDFQKGMKQDQCVTLSNRSSDSKAVITADAVKFGGGYGNIARKPSLNDEEGNPVEVDFDVEPETSGYPRFTEGSRYWLQWAGFNDSIYSWTLDTNDYTDDYMSRGRWVNALLAGSYLNPKKQGYNIPLDLSFAFHTDAGTTLDDSIVGTLSIYTRLSNNSDRYINGENRIAGRELAETIQTELVRDVRANFEPEWTRRYLWDRSYAESRTPEVPAMLLEFLSHQNLADMRYGLDPSFRFTVSRAIYKGMLKFVAYMNDFQYTVQPLPVCSFASDICSEDGNLYAKLDWQPVEDPLEETAFPTGYIVYSRKDNGAFDNGTPTNECCAKIAIEPGHIYSFKVCATNDGGESFPSETLSVGLASSEAPVAMIVNNFDRVSAPVSYASKDSLYGGFQDKVDAGVPYIRDISYIGSQHEFRRHIPWMDDDSAGFGASDADYETVVVAGNTFDYPFVHGKALLEAGYSFASASRSALNEGRVDLFSYPMVDLICGKEITTQVGRPGANSPKYTVFTSEIQNQLKEYTNQGGNLLVSGANIASDIWEPIFPVEETYKKDVLDPAREFVTNVLKYRWMTNSASANGTVRSVQNPLGIKSAAKYTFCTQPNERCYAVESADGINPVGDNAFTIFRYAENNISAGVAYCGKDYKAVSLGFPIETLTDEEQIADIIKTITDFFSK